MLRVYVFSFMVSEENNYRKNLSILAPAVKYLHLSAGGEISPSSKSYARSLLGLTRTIGLHLARLAGLETDSNSDKIYEHRQVQFLNCSSL